jgi:hypothetical protein
MNPENVFISTVKTISGSAGGTRRKMRVTLEQEKINLAMDRAKKAIAEDKELKAIPENLQKAMLQTAGGYKIQQFEGMRNKEFHALAKAATDYQGLVNNGISEGQMDILYKSGDLSQIRNIFSNLASII